MAERPEEPGGLETFPSVIPGNYVGGNKTFVLTTATTDSVWCSMRPLNSCVARHKVTFGVKQLTPNDFF